jgi:hypothetical protein
LMDTGLDDATLVSHHFSNMAAAVLAGHRKSCVHLETSSSQTE